MPKNVPWSVSVPTCMVTCVVTCMVSVDKVFKHNQCAKINCGSDDAEDDCQPVWWVDDDLWNFHNYVWLGGSLVFACTVYAPTSDLVNNV